MKRAQSCNTSYASQEKKRKVSFATFEKCRCDFDREFKTVSWLECEIVSRQGGRCETKCESAVEGGEKA